jgi:hypothetical protein
LEEAGKQRPRQGYNPSDPAAYQNPKEQGFEGTLRIDNPIPYIENHDDKYAKK